MSKVGLVDWFIAGGWLQLGSLTSIVACQLLQTRGAKEDKVL